MKLPAGTTTISGQLGQSLNGLPYPGLMQRCWWAPILTSTPSQCCASAVRMNVHTSRHAAANHALRVRRLTHFPINNRTKTISEHAWEAMRQLMRCNSSPHRGQLGVRIRRSTEKPPTADLPPRADVPDNATHTVSSCHEAVSLYNNIASKFSYFSTTSSERRASRLSGTASPNALAPQHLRKCREDALA
jgi:hypothetical protein